MKLVPLFVCLACSVACGAATRPCVCATQSPTPERSCEEELRSYVSLRDIASTMLAESTRLTQLNAMSEEAGTILANAVRLVIRLNERELAHRCLVMLTNNAARNADLRLHSLTSITPAQRQELELIAAGGTITRH